MVMFVTIPNLFFFAGCPLVYMLLNGRKKGDAGITLTLGLHRSSDLWYNKFTTTWQRYRTLSRAAVTTLAQHLYSGIFVALQAES